MIISFKCKDTENLYKGKIVKKFSTEILKRALNKLSILNRAKCLDDIRVPPANRLETLQGYRVGQYSIRINHQYRICFEWNEVTKKVSNVEIIDYH